MNPARSIAAAIVAKLQAQSWASGLTIVRAYRPDWELKNFGDDTRLSVICGTEDSERQTRESQGEDIDYVIRVLIQRKLDIDPKINPTARNVGEVAAVDPMMDLFWRVGQFIREAAQKVMGPSRYISEEMTPLDDSRLHQLAMYAAMRSITYRYFYDSEWGIDNVTLSDADFLAKWGPDGLGNTDENEFATFRPDDVAANFRPEDSLAELR